MIECFPFTGRKFVLKSVLVWLGFPRHPEVELAKRGPRSVGNVVSLTALTERLNGMNGIHKQNIFEVGLFSSDKGRDELTASMTSKR